MTARERLEGTLVGLEYDWASDDVLLLREQVEEALREAANNALELAAQVAEDYAGRQGESAEGGPTSGDDNRSGQDLAQSIRSCRNCAPRQLCASD